MPLEACQLAHLYERYFKELRQFPQRFGEVTYADRAVMRGAFRVPGLNECLGADRELVMTICIPYLQHFAWNGLGLCRKQLEPARGILHNRQERHEAVLYAHLHRQATPHL